MSSVATVPVPHWVLEMMHYSCLFVSKPGAPMCMLCTCVLFLQALFLHMYKTSFWGVLTSLVAFVLKAVAFFCFIQPLAHFPAQAFGFDMRQASISQQLPFLPSLWAAIFFLILGILQYFCIIYVTLTSAFVQSIGLIEPKRKCVLLCLSLPSAL